MSGELVTAVLSEAWHKFGGFPVAQQGEIAQWVHRRVRAIQEGAPRAIDIAPVLPRPFTATAAPTWYEREPGEEG
jgi:hypothetical protein